MTDIEFQLIAGQLIANGTALTAARTQTSRGAIVHSMSVCAVDAVTLTGVLPLTVELR